ncbi:MAG TPA: sulfatase [Kofleriaceae bacterium]|nr:sulfatase [Kofleriaceae bacterium]
MKAGTASQASAAALAVFVAAAACGKQDTDGKAATGVVPGESRAPGAGKTAQPGGKAAPAPQAPARGPEHAVFSLVDNRLGGHLQRGGGLVVPAGSAGFAKYLRFGGSSPAWQMRRSAGGVKFATMKSKVAGIRVPLTEHQVTGSPAIRVRARSGAAQRLGVRVNNRRDSEVTVQLAAGWSTAELAVPPGALVAGENDIVFFAGQPGLDVDWVQVGGEPAGDDATAFHDAATKSLLLPQGGGMAWYVVVPERGLVTGDIDDGACQVAVRLTPEGGEAIQGKLVGRGSAVDLGAAAGKAARLELSAAGCPVARLSGAELRVAGKAPEVARKAAPKHVVLWIMDALRADRVHVINERAVPETPTFDKLLETSTVFTQAYVQGNETKCSHASIWTSLYPINHGMIPPSEHIDTKWVTVDEVAKSAGLFTSGVSGNGYITIKRGFGEKWDKYRNHIHEGGGLRAEDILKKGIESITRPKDPFFLYLGSIDTHVSWRGKQPWLSQYDKKPYSGRFKLEASGVDMGKVSLGKLKVNARDIQRIIALYDSNVSYQDQQLGLLLDKLDEWGIADETMVIVVADHGDELFEAGRVGHGGSVLETLVHVPFVIRFPPLFPAGRVSEGVEVVDIVPTIADALGVEADEHWQGESLIPLAQGVGRGYPRLSMASKYELAHAARMGRWKVYSSGGRSELYDLVDEPEEKTDRAADKPMALRLVSDALWLLRANNAAWRKSRWGNPANVTAAFAADMGE